MKYGIAVFPTKEIQDFANTYRKRYDPHYSLIQPHMTVREPEEWDDERLAASVSELEKRIGQLAPFPLRFNRVSSFFPAGNVIYIAPDDPEPFNALHQAVCQDILAEPNRPFQFKPHLTIGQQLGSDELHDVWASLRNVPVDLRMIVDRVHLLYQTDNLAWTVYQTFLLKKA